MARGRPCTNMSRRAVGSKAPPARAVRPTTLDFPYGGDRKDGREDSDDQSGEFVVAASQMPRGTCASSSRCWLLRIVIDALGASENSGGMRLHAEETIRAWIVAFPDDELHVVGPRWISGLMSLSPRMHHHDRENTRSISRAFGQFLIVPRISRQVRADAVVSLSPVISPLLGGRPTVCFVHDWRHLKNPAEFSAAQRFYRRQWLRSARRAGAVACVSQKTLRETQAITGREKGLGLVENGRDHPAHWGLEGAPRDDARRAVVTFGHHVNKRPDLVLRGFARLPLNQRRELVLTILGARGEWAVELAALADELGVGRAVELPGFVAEDVYRLSIAHAAVVVLASSDEGFGLPVVEAQFFGVPVVVATDGGLGEIHGGLIVAEPTVDAMAVALTNGLAMHPSIADAAPGPTWADGVRRLRSMLTNIDTRGESD